MMQQATRSIIDRVFASITERKVVYMQKSYRSLITLILLILLLGEAVSIKHTASLERSTEWATDYDQIDLPGE